MLPPLRAALAAIVTVSQPWWRASIGAVQRGRAGQR
jgi:hypothetical protein